MFELIDEEGTVEKDLTSGFVSTGCNSAKIDECVSFFHSFFKKKKIHAP